MSNDLSDVPYMLGQIDGKLDALADRYTAHEARLGALEGDSVRTKVLAAGAACLLFGKDHLLGSLALLLPH